MTTLATSQPDTWLGGRDPLRREGLAMGEGLVGHLALVEKPLEAFHDSHRFLLRSPSGRRGTPRLAWGLLDECRAEAPSAQMDRMIHAATRRRYRAGAGI